MSAAPAPAPLPPTTYGLKEFVGGSKPVINIPSIQTIFQVWIRRLNAILQRGLNERRPLRRCTRAVNPIPLNDPTSLLSQSWTLLPLQSSKPTVTCFSLHGRPISLSFPKTSLFHDLIECRWASKWIADN